MRHKILWIDDEHEKLTFMKLMAEQNDLELICETNIEDGIAAFERNAHQICGIILDIRCPMDSGTNKAPDDTSNVTSALARLIGIKGAKNYEYIPIYLYSGAGPEYLRKMTIDWHHENIRAYDKSDDEQSYQLLSDIVKSISFLPFNKIRVQHKNIFDCTFFEEEAVKLLQELTNRTNINTLRSIGETAFAKIVKRLGLLKSDISINTLPINKSCQELRYCDTAIIPVYVGEACSYVARIGNSASHNTEYNDTRYLYDSVLQSLLVVMNWAATELRTDMQAHLLSSTLEKLRSNRSSIDWDEIDKPEKLKGRFLQLKGDFWGDARYKLRPRKDLEVCNGTVIEIIDAQWDRECPDGVFFINSYRIVDKT